MGESRIHNRNAKYHLDSCGHILDISCYQGACRLGWYFDAVGQFTEHSFHHHFQFIFMHTVVEQIFEVCDTLVRSGENFDDRVSFR